MVRVKFRTNLSTVTLLIFTCLISLIEGGRKVEERARRSLIDEAGDGSSPNSEPDGNQSCTNEYNVLQLRLILNWAPGICITGKPNCKTPKAKFVIEGLRPLLKDIQPPLRCCSKERFDRSVLLPLTSELKDDWSSLDGTPDENLWPHEWENYGRCTSKIRGIHTIFHYFNFVLKNFNKLALKNRLIAQGFLPTNQRSYYGQNIMRSLTTHYGFRPAMKCAPIVNSPQKIALTQVHFCYDNKLAAKDCPYADNDCFGEMMLPKFAN